eukprot:10969280-Alexandrium_andersonii.AAC.1
MTPCLAFKDIGKDDSADGKTNETRDRWSGRSARQWEEASAPQVDGAQSTLRCQEGARTPFENAG